MLPPESLRKFTVPLKKITGAVFLLEPIRKHYCKVRRTVQINDFDSDLSINVSLNEHMGSQIFWYGSYSRDILLSLDQHLKPGMTFLDVGANIGEITLFAGKRVGQSGRVLSFEPSDESADQLEANIALNKQTQTKVLRKGASDKAGTAPIFTNVTSFKDGSKNHGLTTLYASVDRNEKVGDIQLVTIDEVVSQEGLDRVDGIKIDIEGAELPALKGAVNTLTKFRPWLIVEVQDETARTAGYRQEDVLDFLAKLGYRFEHIGRKGHNTELTSATLQGFQNVLCIPA